MDPGFSITYAQPVYSIAQQPGSSSWILGAHNQLVRVLDNGTTDSSFTGYNYGPVQTVVSQTDGKVLFGGAFVVKVGVTRDYFERYKITGGIDTDFKGPYLDQKVNAIALQRDGKILMGGEFLNVTVPKVTGNGVDVYPQVGLMRLNPDGTFDTTFRPAINGIVNTLVVQVDGTIVIGGAFTTVGQNGGATITRRGIARIHANGNPDSSFDAGFTNSSYLVRSLFIQEDGKIMVGGRFQFAGGSTIYRVARLHNDGVITDNYKVKAINANTVKWTRHPSAQEALSVTFQYSFDNSNWLQLGSGQGIREPGTGNWTITPGPIPPNCYLRAVASLRGGIWASSFGQTSSSAPHPLPVFALRKAGAVQFYPENSVIDLGYVGLNEATVWPCEVVNGGTGTLNVTQATFGGSHASLFSIGGSLPQGIPLGGSGALNFDFSPSSLGVKTATVNFTSNDVENPDFAVSLRATVVAPIEAFRHRYFGVLTDTGNAADSADPDGDGQTNFFEFVAGLNPTDKNSRFEQRVDRSSGTPQVIFSPRLTDRTYEILTSTTMESNDWSTAAGSSVDAGQQRTFTHTGVMDAKRFYRIKITK